MTYSINLLHCDILQNTTFAQLLKFTSSKAINTYPKVLLSTPKHFYSHYSTQHYKHNLTPLSISKNQINCFQCAIPTTMQYILLCNTNYNYYAIHTTDTKIDTFQTYTHILAPVLGKSTSKNLFAFPKLECGQHENPSFLPQKNLKTTIKTAHIGTLPTPTNLCKLTRRKSWFTNSPFLALCKLKVNHISTTFKPFKPP